MLVAELTDVTVSSPKSADPYMEINAIKLTGDQLNRAFQVQGAAGAKRMAALTAYAEREGITPVSHAAQALMIRMGLVADLIDGPGIENDDWNYTLEALARVRLIDEAEALPIGESGVSIDEIQFEELREFAREMPW